MKVIAQRGPGIYVIAEQDDGLDGDGWVFNVGSGGISRKQSLQAIFKFGYWTELDADVDTESIESHAAALIAHAEHSGGTRM
jgi:hypothetical protein